MTFYDITEQNKELIKTAFETLEKNFDDGIYNHIKTAKENQSWAV